MCANELEICKNAMEIRKNLRSKQANEETVENEQAQLIQLAGYHVWEKQHVLQPKTPQEAPYCLYCFWDTDNERYVGRELELNAKIDIKKIQTFPILWFEDIQAADLGVTCPWTEDYMHIFQDGTVGTALPFYDNGMVEQEIKEGQRRRLETEHSKLYCALTTSYANQYTVYMPNAHPNHFFLRSMVDGGNILPGKDFALIGKDSLYVTCIQNGMGEDEAKALIAHEMGYDVQQLYFVEQPGTYHLDLNMMLLGKGEDGRERVWVNKDFKGVSLESIYGELSGYGFDVIVDEEQIAGEAVGTIPRNREEKGTTTWQYNFYNGEFVHGKDGKLYYVTNGCECRAVEERFEQRLKSYIPELEGVIFCRNMTAETLNTTHGGVGCRLKGGPVKVADGLMD